MNDITLKQAIINNAADLATKGEVDTVIDGKPYRLTFQAINTTPEAEEARLQGPDGN